MLDLFLELAVAAEMSDPDAAAGQWLFLFEGCEIALGFRLGSASVAAARAAATALFDGAPRRRLWADPV
jgi:hypothetical protein